MSSRPIGMNDAGAVASADSANLRVWLIPLWLLAAGIWSIHRLAPELLGFSTDFLLYGSPYTLSLPILALAALALGGAITLLAASHHDRTSAMDELLLAYLFARCVLAVSLALPLYDEGAAWSTVDIYHGPPLTWLVAAALPLGLGLAFLIDRFRPRPESLPPAPGS